MFEAKRQRAREIEVIILKFSLEYWTWLTV